MKTKDFLADNQPRATTVRCLWYLHQFFDFDDSNPNIEKWTGITFEKQLKQLQLDFSLDSLKRIDKLLDAIRNKFSPTPEEFLQQENIKNQNFVFFLGFYCGEVVGRSRKRAPIWWDYEDYIAESPDLAMIYPPAIHNFFLCRLIDDNGYSDFFPLVAIMDKLFNPQPEKSVFFSTTTFVPQGINPTKKLPSPPAEHLDFSGKDLIQQTPPQYLPYLQMLPPSWMWSDPLLKQMDNLGHLYSKGKVVWASLVQANNLLFKYENHNSCPAEVVYDPSGRTDPHSLRDIAKRLYSLKNSDESEQERQEKEDAYKALLGQPLTSELHEYAEHITNENTRLFTNINISHIPIKTATVFIWVPHLPNGILTLPFFPILISEETDTVTLLPAKYWTHTEFYKDWFSYQESLNKQTDIEDNPIELNKDIPNRETTLGFEALLNDSILNNTPAVWDGYNELLYPQVEEISDLMGNINETDELTTQSMGEWFIKRCVIESQVDYRRFYEEVPNEKGLQTCIEQLLGNTSSQLSFADKTRLYARFTLLDFDHLLNQLTDDSINQRLNQTSMPKVAKLINQQKISSLQCAQLIRFLKKEGDKGVHEAFTNEVKPGEPQREHKNNTTALLYLAYLYGTGKFVPLSLNESIIYFNYSSSLGDWRATHFIAEILFAIPESSHLVWEQKVLQDSAHLSLYLMSHGMNVMKIEELKEEFLAHRPAMLEVVRSLYTKAHEQGHPHAHQRLQQLIQAGKIPTKMPETRLQNIQTWVEDYINSNPKVRADLQASEQAQALNEQQYKPKNTTKRFLIGGVLIVVGFILWQMFQTDDEIANAQEQPAQPKSEIIENNTHSNQPNKENIDNGMVDRPTFDTKIINNEEPVRPAPNISEEQLTTAITKIKRKLPTKFKMDNSLTILDIKQGSDTIPVIIDVQSYFHPSIKQDVMVSINNAKAIYCRDSLFNDIYKEVPVKLSFYKNDGSHWYDVDVQPDEC